MRQRSRSRGNVRGFTLLEALIAILIFSFGILALMGLQATAISDVRDAKYRADAAFLANAIIGAMWSDDPDNNLTQYALNTGGANCAFVGGSAAPGGSQAATNIANWQAQVNATLPGAGANRQQITVDAVSRRVTVTLCWQAAQDVSSGTFHSHSVSTLIKGPNAL